MSRVGLPGEARGGGAAAGAAHHSSRAQKTPPLLSLASGTKKGGVRIVKDFIRIKRLALIFCDIL